MQILIVEDNPDVAWGLSRMLCHMGHDVVSCLNASSALNAVELVLPDLVLLDIGLPEMDGYGLAALLRQRGLRKTPIMALSAQQDDAVKRRAASIDAHYVKPIGLADIEQIIEKANAG
jgi:CheY-like chemotaxis protein